MSTADELKKLKDLFDDGVLTQEEFDVEKKKVLESQDTIPEKANIKKPEEVVEKEKILATIKISNKIYYKLLYILPLIFLSFTWWALITFGFFVSLFLVVETTHYEITKNKIGKYESFIRKDSREIERDAVETVSVRQGPIQRLLQTGDILITGKGISNFVIKDIDDPESIHKLLSST